MIEEYLALQGSVPTSRPASPDGQQKPVLRVSLVWKSYVMYVKKNILSPTSWRRHSFEIPLCKSKINSYALSLAWIEPLHDEYVYNVVQWNRSKPRAEKQ